MLKADNNSDKNRHSDVLVGKFLPLQRRSGPKAMATNNEEEVNIHN